MGSFEKRGRHFQLDALVGRSRKEVDDFQCYLVSPCWTAVALVLSPKEVPGSLGVALVVGFVLEQSCQSRHGAADFVHCCQLDC